MTTRLTDVFTGQEIIAIGTEAMTTMDSLGHDVYQHKMTYEDEWFAICVRAVPDKEQELIDWISTSEGLPGEIISRIIYDAERVVFGVTLAEYSAGTRHELLFSGFCCIRLAQHRADDVMGRTD